MMPAVSARVDLATPAEPDQGVPSSTRARLKAAALGVVGALLVPLPAAAAPAPCDQALRYAAQSGTELMRIGDLNLGPTGRTEKPIRNVGVGDLKSALVAPSTIKSAALGRLLDSGEANRRALAEVLQQTAPPSHKKPRRQQYEATEAGPFSLGRSELSVHARWNPEMACGNAAGEVTRSEVVLRRVGVLEDGDASLVRVPGKIAGVSTTAMERPGPGARAVAEASMESGRVELLGGAVAVKIVEPPSLLAMMSGTDGGEVRYKPAVLEVSGEGFDTTRLDTAGDRIELRLDKDGNPATDDAGSDDSPRRSATEDSAGQPEARQKPGGRANAAQADTAQADTGQADAGVESASNDIALKRGAPGSNRDKSGDALFGRLPGRGLLESGGPLPLPTLPGVPPLADRPTETAPAAGPGTTVQVSLGDVRQAVSGHAIAAKATAMTIAISKGPDRQAYAPSPGTPTGIVLNLGLGLLEVAAVAPEPAGGVSDAVVGSAGGLPITGPRVDVLALTGLAMLIAGAAALIFGMRSRSRS